MKALGFNSPWSLRCNANSIYYKLLFKFISIELSNMQSQPSSQLALMIFSKWGEKMRIEFYTTDKIIQGK